MKTTQAQEYSVMLAPAAAATTVRTANIDCAGANYATIALTCGAELNTSSTNVAVTLLESDDTVVTNFATFNTNNAVTVDNTAAAVHCFHVDMDGRKRYLRLSVTPDATTNGPVLTSAVALLDKSPKVASTHSVS